MVRCNEELKAAPLPYPQTCARCGLGPCHKSTESYASHPVSVAEIKSDRTDDPRVWTPRDALISLLREIDSGKVSPYSIAILFASRESDRATNFSYRISSPGIAETLGLIEGAKFLILTGANEEMP